MIVQNLIYNRLGNSFSLMVDTGDEIVQLHDEINFTINGKQVDIYGVSNLEEKRLKVGIKIDEKSLELLLKKDLDTPLSVGFNGIENITLKYSDGFKFFVPDEDFNLIMKLINRNFNHISYEKKQNGYILTIGEGENFIKGIIELLMFLEKI